MPVPLAEVVTWCNARVRHPAVADFPGACNGLQLENAGTVHKLGAAVDAGLYPFRAAQAQGVDFLIVHHGLFWQPNVPLTGRYYTRLKTALEADLAVYSAHLPLDAHPEIGNNALLARALELEPERFFLEHEGVPIALIARAPLGRKALRARLESQFPGTLSCVEYGSEALERVAILSGSGRSALDHLRAEGLDTLITGELRQEHFNLAQELGLNLYCAGHYATEVFGVRALAAEAAAHFGLDWGFLEEPCPW